MLFFTLIQEDEVIRHFFKTNKIDILKSGGDISLKERSVFQQWFSLCYSLQLFASYANLTIVDHNNTKFSEHTNFANIAVELISNTTAKKNTKKTSKRKVSKRKEQPKKRFKKQ